ncbi:MAG: cytochrome c oxidase subunit II [bacterium]|nr:cytochrome c oxidase subunit II [bacterium]
MAARTRNKNGRLRLLLTLPVLAFLASCSGSGPQSALEPKGPIARDIDGLWDLVYWLAVAVFIMVTALLVWAMWRYRERPGDETEPKQLHGSAAIELGGVVFSVVLLAIISVPTVRGLLDMRQVPEGDDVIQIQVTGHQWWWEFEYVDETGPDGATLITANELHIPEDATVYLTMTSADVIHSFWIPAVNGKRDVVPGQVTNLTIIADDPTSPDEPLPGQCAEFCGLAHADMRIKLHVHTDADYAAWLDEQFQPSQLPAEESELAAGWSTFNTVCTTCHQVSLEDVEGEVVTYGPERHIAAADIQFRSSFGPNLTHLFSRGTFGAGTVELTESHLAEWIGDPQSLKPMNPDENDLAAGRVLGMPDTGLNADEISEVIELLKTWR